ncbi:hypothetical protein COP1_018158 [Malus domestica]
MRLLSTQMLRPEVEEVEEDTFLQKGLEGSKAVYCDCRDFLKQRQENPLPICLKINDSKFSERLGPLPRPRPAANLGKERQVPNEHEGTGDSEVFPQTAPNVDAQNQQGFWYNRKC